MRVYVKDGKVLREEPSGTLPVIDPNVPDYNPMGCMQGTCWSQSLDGPDRAAFPLKRAGERGEGKWEQISWEQALTEIADKMLDAIETMDRIPSFGTERRRFPLLAPPADSLMCSAGLAWM